MLGRLCSRPKTWILNTFSLFSHHGSAANHYLHSHHNKRLLQTGIVPLVADKCPRLRHPPPSCRLNVSGGSAASIWHAILPSNHRGGDYYIHWPRQVIERKGEGSWNVLWDARPARWLFRPDSVWFTCLSPHGFADTNIETAAVEEKSEDSDQIGPVSDQLNSWRAPDYKVTGVPADGRCLFRALAHGTCLRKGEEAPDEIKERELADKLRAEVVDELSKRREETEWFIEENFDTYVKNMRQTYTWGGEPELVMASHVLKTSISVFMTNKISGTPEKIADYGKEYRKEEDEESPINVLFHGYGHYDLLEIV